MNKIKNYLIGLVCVLMGCLCTACSNDDLDTNQYKGGVSLNVFGPSPVMRGGELRFIGSGMDQVTAVVIPGCAEHHRHPRVISGEPKSPRHGASGMPSPALSP